MYEYQPVNPLQGFAQGLQFVQGLQQQRQQQQQQIDETEQKARRQIDLQRAVQNLRVNPSPEAMAEFGLQFPEMKEQLEGYFKTLDAGKKSTQVAAARDVIIAQRGGGNVQEVFERYATAAENSRDPEMAKIFRDAAEVAKTDPAAAAETARIHLAFGDPDAYKLVFDNSMYDTANIKETLAEGFEFGTPAFQARLKEKNDRDPLVPVSGVGLFDRQAVINAIKTGATEVTPDIPEAAVKELIQNPGTAKFFDQEFGKGAAARILGGGSSDATGSF